MRHGDNTTRGTVVVDAGERLSAFEIDNFAGVSGYEAPDITAKFKRLGELKDHVSGMVFEINEEIKRLKETADDLAEPYQNEIKVLEDEIKAEVSLNKESFKSIYGSAVYRKGARLVKWDDSALMGYVASGHPELEQFRKESEGQSSVVLKVI